MVIIAAHSCSLLLISNLLSAHLNTSKHTIYIECLNKHVFNLLVENEVIVTESGKTISVPSSRNGSETNIREAAAETTSTAV